MVVQIFVSQRHRLNTLTDHRLHLVKNLPALAPVTERTRHFRRQTDPAVDFATSARGTTRDTSGGEDVLAQYDDNRNGGSTCKEARRHGIAPVHRSHPAYRYIPDGDGDGVVCE